MVQANRFLPLVPTFGVKLNGKSMTKGMAPWIAGIQVHEQINLPGLFELQLVGRDIGDRATQWVDDPRLELGAQIELSFGYDAQLDTVISGEITDLEPAFTMSGPPQLVVRGQDNRYRLNGAPHTKSFENLKASTIAESIAAHVMAFKATDSEVEIDHQLQDNETDLAFLQRLATDIGYELVMEGATLLFRPRANDRPPEVTLTFADDLFDFRLHMMLPSVSKVTGSSWDPQEEQEERVITASVDPANPEDERSKMGPTLGTKHAGHILGDTANLLVPLPVMTQAELDQRVRALHDAAGLDYIRGDGSCRGRTDVRAGRVIRIDRIGSRFSGSYYVTSAAHSYTPGDGYTTSFQVRRNAA